MGPANRALIALCQNCGSVGEVALGMAQLPLCGSCRRTGVLGRRDADPLFNVVVRWLNQSGLTYNGLDVRYELVADAAPRAQALAATVLHRVISPFGQFARVRQMLIRRGLPPLLFRRVIAHEFGHIYLGVVVAAAGLPPNLEEGFCELVAHRFLRSLGPTGAVQAASIENNPDPHYGDGFRAVYSRLGHLPLAEAARRLAGIPDGHS